MDAPSDKPDASGRWLAGSEIAEAAAARRKQRFFSILSDAPGELERRRGLISGGALLLALAIGIGLPLRLAIAPLHPAALALTLTCLAGFLAVPVVARITSSLSLPGALFIGSFLLMVVAVGYVVGGLAGPVLAIAPLIPMVAAFIVGVRAGWWAAALLSLAFAVFAALLAAGHSFPPSPLTGDAASLARGLILSVACLLAAALAWLHERQNTKLQQLLLEQSIHDSLTGVANRRHFDDSLEKECRRAARLNSHLSVVLFDLDHFKQYNDSLGHQQGDRCLILVARAAESWVNRAGDLLARYGGEEFAAILFGSSPEDALELAERLREKIEQLRLVHPTAPGKVVTISVGVATAVDRDQLTPDHLVGQADRALYRAKRAGRNRVAGAKTG